MKKKATLMAVTIVLLVLMSTGYVFAQYPGYSWSTAYQVVNMGAANANIDIDYYDTSGNVVTAAHKSYTDVPPGSSRLVVQFTDDPLLSGGQYSAVITSNQPVTAILNQQMVANGSSSYNPVPPFSTYNGVGQGSTQVTLPAIMYNWYGYYTEVYIMNAGTANATNVDISYFPGFMNGATTGNSGITDLNNSIPQFASTTKSQQSMSSLGAVSGPFTGRFYGSAVITSDQPIVAVVNQHNLGNYKLMTYNGFSSTESDTKVFAPVHMRGYYGYYSTLMVANPSISQTANVTITYNPTGTANEVIPGHSVGPVTQSFNIDPQKSVLRHDGPTATDDQSDLDDNPSYTRFFGNVVVESNIPVVVQVNVEAVSSGDDQAGTYNGFLDSQATPNIVVPVILADFYGYYTVLIVQNTTNTNGSCDVTYTSDNVYSAVPNHTHTYNHPLPANDSFTVYEGRKGGLETGDINHDPQWRSGSNWRFIGSASITCTVDAVAFVNEELDILQKDSMYTFNAFNK